jgi:hypothetical protein
VGELAFWSWPVVINDFDLGFVQFPNLLSGLVELLRPGDPLPFVGHSSGIAPWLLGLHDEHLVHIREDGSDGLLDEILAIEDSIDRYSV